MLAFTLKLNNRSFSGKATGIVIAFPNPGSVSIKYSTLFYRDYFIGDFSNWGIDNNFFIDFFAYKSFTDWRVIGNLIF